MQDKEDKSVVEDFFFLPGIYNSGIVSFLSLCSTLDILNAHIDY